VNGKILESHQPSTDNDLAFTIAMATVVPPPSKRQKLEAADKSQREAEFARIPDDLGSVRIQFVDQASGNATGPVVAVPVKDATVKNLETVLNTIQGRVGQYHLTPPRERYGRLFFRTPKSNII
jgi:hypothetical protein